VSQPERRLKILDISMQALVRVLADFERVRIVKGLPADAEAAGIYLDNDRQAIGVYVHSKTYDVIPESVALPHVDVHFQIAPEALALGG